MCFLCGSIPTVIDAAYVAPIPYYIKQLFYLLNYLDLLHIVDDSFAIIQIQMLFAPINLWYLNEPQQ